VRLPGVGVGCAGRRRVVPAGCTRIHYPAAQKEEHMKKQVMCSIQLTHDGWHFFDCKNPAKWMCEGRAYCGKHKPRAKWRGEATPIEAPHA
jgi:hypothetical protein